MSLSAAERETTMTVDDEAKTWSIYSSRRSDITRLRKNPDLTVIEEGVFDGTPFLHATLPLGGISIRAKSSGTIKRNGVKRKGMPEDAPRCKGTKKDGSPCGSLAAAGTGYCKRHGKDTKK